MTPAYSCVCQLLSIIGEQFDVGNEICGAVVSLRQSEDILSVWNRNADNLDAVNKIRCVACMRTPSCVGPLLW